MFKFLKALSIFIGTVIGAGVFGIPYVVEKSGIIPGFFYFLILGGTLLLIHLFLSEVILRTKDQCRLPGLAGKYLGGWGKILVMISVVIGTTGALLAFLILGGEFLKLLFSPFTNLSQTQLTFIFWAILSYFVFRGIKVIASIELLTNIFFFLVMIVIMFFCLPKFDLPKINILNVSNVFLPFGVILFSLIGWSAIPEIVDFLKFPKERKEIKKIIILASLIIILFYLAFAVAIIGVAGNNTSQDALSSLLPFLGQKIIVFGALAGLITIADSFLILGLYLSNTFIYDLKLPKNLAALTVCGLPPLLFLVGFRSFIGILGFVGTMIGLIEGIIIILFFKKAKMTGDREPEYSFKIPSLLLYFLMAILILGALSQFFI